MKLGGVMFGIRVYISALTLIFLLLALTIRDVGLLDAIVVTCTLLYLIIDMREELQSLRLIEDQISFLFPQLPGKSLK
jgi:4-amino-4-deoxy-L-arabinose transferase-like glycosyltransferase